MRDARPCDSRDRPISWIMWRANRLADSLAKLAARSHRARPSELQKLLNLKGMQMHAAATLGMVTYMANHHPIPLDGGLTGHVRDACGQRPARQRPRQPQPEQGSSLPESDPHPRPAKRPAQPTGHVAARKARRRASTLIQQSRAAVAEAASLASRLAGLRQREDRQGPTATERLRALTDRVRARRADSL